MLHHVCTAPPTHRSTQIKSFYQTHLHDHHDGYCLHRPKAGIRGSDFKASEEVVAAAGGFLAKLADALSKDVNAFFELYKATTNVVTTAEAVKVPEATGSVAKQRGLCPPSPNEAGGDEAAGSPAASVKLAPTEKDILSSPEDDSSLDETPYGEGNIPSELPVDSQLPQWHTRSLQLRKKGDTRKKLHLLACQFKGMSFGADWVFPPSSPVKTPRPIAMEASWMRVGAARATANLKDNQGDDVAGDRYAGGLGAPNPRPPAASPAQPPAGSGADASGGGDDPHDGDEDAEGNDSDESSSDLDAPDEDDPEDPEQAGMGKFYKAQTPNGKNMVKMFKTFCDHTDRDANTIVMYFGIYSKASLAEFLHDHWKVTFTQWQKRHPNQDSTERAMVLSPLSKTANDVPHGPVDTGAMSHGLPSSSLSRT
jgi:hypothetical protein